MRIAESYLRQLSSVRHDFDQIARALEAAEQPDALQAPERALLAYLPPYCQNLLEVGCGHGALTRRVAQRAQSVVALDLSPEMIRVARLQSTSHPNIEYRVADILTTALPEASFDVVLSVATLHHLPLAETVLRLAAAVRPGGYLLLQDVVARQGILDLPINALAWAVRFVRGSSHRRWGAGSPAVAKLYREHGRSERYLSPRETDRVFASLLPGSFVVHHLEWRYTMVWRRE